MPLDEVPEAVHSLRDVALSLARRGAFPVEQLTLAATLARRQKLPLDVVLHDMGLVSALELAGAAAEATGLPLFRPLDDIVDRDIARRLVRAEAERCAAIPLRDDGTRVAVAMVDVFDPLQDDRIQATFPGRALDKRVATRTDVHDLINNVWSAEPDYLRLEAALGGGPQIRVPGGRDGGLGRQPVVQLCDSLIEHAVMLGASDVHLEPGEHVFGVRMRVDGRLRQVHSFPMPHWQQVLHRFKILAEMDIGKHLVPQRGQFSQHVQGRRINVRAAVLPALHGENLVLRVLDLRRGSLRLDDLALSAGSRERLARVLGRPDGLVLISGTIGSGKTTTAAALLGELASAGRCIVTLEDPVEFVLPHARQVPIRAEQGLGFGDVMREVLRQDADVVFLGEIRETDAASLTVSTAMIGKRMLATVHARDAVAAVARMLSLGVDRQAIAETLVAVTNQRLLPRLCPRCRRDAPDAPGNWHAPGCAACRQTGVLGRIPVMEVLEPDLAMREAIAGGDLPAFRRLAMAALEDHDLAAESRARIDAGDVGGAEVSALVTLDGS